MRKYKCVECEKTFTSEEVVPVKECFGEFWGSPYYETLGGCPHCSSTWLVEYEGEDEEGEDEE